MKYLKTCVCGNELIVNKIVNSKCFNCGERNEWRYFPVGDKIRSPIDGKRIYEARMGDDLSKVVVKVEKDDGPIYKLYKINGKNKILISVYNSRVEAEMEAIKLK